MDLNSLPGPYTYQSSDVQGTRIDGSWSVVSGDEKEVTLEFRFTLDENSKPGTWVLGCTGFRDVNGYKSTNGGHSTSFNVVNN